jgi:hypothetical protein
MWCRQSSGASVVGYLKKVGGHTPRIALILRHRRFPGSLGVGILDGHAVPVRLGRTLPMGHPYGDVGVLLQGEDADMFRLAAANMWAGGAAVARLGNANVCCDDRHSAPAPVLLRCHGDSLCAGLREQR